MVVTWKSADLIEAVLDSLDRALEKLPGSEVIVADNASNDATVKLARARGVGVIELGSNAGFAAGINAGVAAARDGNDILVLNPDVRLEPGSVDELAAALQTPRTGIAVPMVVDPEGRLTHSLRRRPTVRRAFGEALLGGRLAGRMASLGEVVRDPAEYGRPGVHDWASGAVMLIARDCLEATGGWDESFFLYSEETDFALRAGDAGFTLRYVPSATATHVGGSLHTSPRLWSILVSNKVRLFARRHGRLHTAAFRVAVAINEAVRAVAGRGKGLHAAGFWAAVRTPAALGKAQS